MSKAPLALLFMPSSLLTNLLLHVYKKTNILCLPSCLTLCSFRSLHLNLSVSEQALYPYLGSVYKSGESIGSPDLLPVFVDCYKTSHQIDGLFSDSYIYQRGQPRSLSRSPNSSPRKMLLLILMGCCSFLGDEASASSFPHTLPSSQFSLT